MKTSPPKPPPETEMIAKAGSFRGAALIVPTGVDAGLIAVALRGPASSSRVRSRFRPPLASSQSGESQESEEERRRREQEG